MGTGDPDCVVDEETWSEYFFGETEEGEESWSEYFASYLDPTEYSAYNSLGTMVAAL